MIIEELGPLHVEQVCTLSATGMLDSTLHRTLQHITCSTPTLFGHQMHSSSKAHS